MIVEENKSEDFLCVKDGFCKGSHCMAWRWAEEERKREGADPLGRNYFYKAPSTTHGYCGLAGRP